MSQYHPVRFVDVRLEGDFWKERLDTVLARTIPSQHKKLTEYGYLNSLKLPSPPPPLRFPRHANGFTVQVFWDSDIGKWIEAAAYALSHRRDADIEARIEAIVDDFEKAQAPDGYLNCWYLGREPEKRWSNLQGQPRALQCRPHAGRRHRLLRDHRPAALARHHGALCRAHPPELRHRPGPEARLLRPPGDRDRADQALSPDRGEEAPRARRLFHQRARPPAAALFRRRARGAREEGLGNPALRAGHLRVQPVAQAGARSRRRSSGTPCAPCTCTRPWPTSRSSSTMPG